MNIIGNVVGCGEYDDHGFVDDKGQWRKTDQILFWPITSIYSPTWQLGNLNLSFYRRSWSSFSIGTFQCSKIALDQGNLPKHRTPSTPLQIAAKCCCDFFTSGAIGSQRVHLRSLKNSSALWGGLLSWVEPPGGCCKNCWSLSSDHRQQCVVLLHQPSTTTFVKYGHRHQMALSSHAGKVFGC